MFKYSLDKKSEITFKNQQILNLADSIFDLSKSLNTTYIPYKLTSDYKMRPDLISISGFGTDEYTEIILKLNGIINPFSVDENDVILMPNIDDVTPNLVDNKNKTNYDNIIKSNTNKYLDKSKIPSNSVSNTDYENQNIGKNISSVNYSPDNTSSIINRNGRIYFGENSDMLCAQNGITSGDYLVAKVSNSNKKTNS